MKFLSTELPGVIIVEPDVHRDARGTFLETHHQQKYEVGGIRARFVQDNFSRSTRGTVRGLHAQSRNPQGKLIRVIRGEVFDVAVDIRRGSPTFGRWVGVTLSGDNFKQVYIPPGMAHGFCVLTDTAEVAYKCTGFYDPSDEICILWNDSEIGIRWPVDQPNLSEKDRTAPRLRNLEERLPIFEGGSA